MQAFWVAQILYKFTINLTKTSICLLYLRIFPNLRFRRLVYVLLTFVVLYAFASIIATIAQCTPLERAWDHSVKGSCINLTAFWYANAAANILGDCLILGLPMPVIKSLKLPRRQRVGLILVFALGGLYVERSENHQLCSMLTSRKRMHHICSANDYPQDWFRGCRCHSRYSQFNHLDHRRGRDCDHLRLPSNAKESVGSALSFSVPSRLLCPGVLFGIRSLLSSQTFDSRARRRVWSMESPKGARSSKGIQSYGKVSLEQRIHGDGPRRTTGD